MDWFVANCGMFGFWILTRLGCTWMLVPPSCRFCPWAVGTPGWTDLDGDWAIFLKRISQSLGWYWNQRFSNLWTILLSVGNLNPGCWLTKIFWVPGSFCCCCWRPAGCFRTACCFWSGCGWTAGRCIGRGIGTPRWGRPAARPGECRGEGLTTRAFLCR